MHVTPSAIVGLTLLVGAFAVLPDKYKPVCPPRLKSWQTLVGLAAVIAAVLIVMNPEFYALGLLGDSTFFDLLVLAISLQIQTALARAWRSVSAGCVRFLRGTSLRYCLLFWMLIASLSTVVAATQKAAQRIFS